jgi:uncharacterized protein
VTARAGRGKSCYGERVLWSIVRVLLFDALTAALHCYVWARVIRGPGRARRTATAALILLYASGPLATSSRMWAPALSHVLAWIALPWLAFVGLCACALAAVDLPRLAARLAQRAPRRAPGHAPAPDLASRRAFLARVTGGAAAVVAGASVARGIAEARGEHEVVDVEVPLAKLPRALDGFTIVQLSDLHAGLTIDRAFVARVVERANRLAPDVLALTGDLVDGPVEDLRDVVAPLADLRARHGVFAVTGNHEYYAGADAWIAALTPLGIRYLRNERVVLGAGDARFELAGVEDESGARHGHPEDLHAATAGRDPSRALVLLAHQPRQVRRARHHGVDLQLSGHTHGGQLLPLGWLARLFEPHVAGLARFGATQLYVSEGTGFWGPPMRIGTSCEIAAITLVASSPPA